MRRRTLGISRVLEGTAFIAHAVATAEDEFRMLARFPGTAEDVLAVTSEFVALELADAATTRDPAVIGRLRMAGANI